MLSSNRFGGGTAAGPRVQIGPASGTEAGTVFTTQEKVALHRQRQLLPHHISEIYRLGPLGQGVGIGIVGSVRIGGEDRRVDVDIDLAQHLGQAPAAITSDHGMNMPAPEVLPVSGGLQLPPHSHRSDQREVQSGKRRIVGRELAVRPDRPSLELPDIHSQHSRLS
jgi:hypothetical protein